MIEPPSPALRLWSATVNATAVSVSRITPMPRARAVPGVASRRVMRGNLVLLRPGIVTTRNDPVAARA